MTQPITQRSTTSAMLIRKPVHEVFLAFIDPEITTKFWFTKSSGSLEEGKQVTWEWKMYNVSSQVTIQRIVVDKQIRITWEGYENPTQVEWSFDPHAEDKTFVTIMESGFAGEGDKLIEQIIAATGGWTWVLAGLKALLEHNIQLNLVADRFPEGK